MGWVSVLLSILAVLLMFIKGHTILMILATIVAIGSFWSWGIMHNYVTELAKHRPDYKGGFYDFTEKEVQSVPNWITIVNISFSLLGITLLICGIFIKGIRN